MTTKTKMAASRVLIYGGKGALGVTCVNFFKSKSWVRIELSQFCHLA